MRYGTIQGTDPVRKADLTVTQQKKATGYSRINMPLLCPVVGKEKTNDDNSNEIKRAGR